MAISRDQSEPEFSLFKVKGLRASTGAFQPVSWDHVRFPTTNIPVKNINDFQWHMGLLGLLFTKSWKSPQPLPTSLCPFQHWARWLLFQALLVRYLAHRPTLQTFVCKMISPCRYNTVETTGMYLMHGIKWSDMRVGELSFKASGLTASAQVLWQQASWHLMMLSSDFSKA